MVETYDIWEIDFIVEHAIKAIHMQITYVSLPYI